ncbi:hypothetical protein NQ318_007479 [Aromia moschata]|uniref:SAP domain-containing protein n=1 Tax=Aromia moschata TaxID=1265417 RepID=A0AAV8YEF6_9CUCU|nr:hypothetical protein NQ318_007479 [Aromia moschata]
MTEFRVDPYVVREESASDSSSRSTVAGTTPALISYLSRGAGAPLEDPTITLTEPTTAEEDDGGACGIPPGQTPPGTQGRARPERPLADAPSDDAAVRPASGGVPAVDIAILTETKLRPETRNLTFPVQPQVLQALSSDHNPILLAIPDGDKDDVTTVTYDYRRTDWRRYRDCINAHLSIGGALESPADIDNAVDELTDAITRARRASTKMASLKPRETTLPPDICDLIRFKNRVKRKWQKNRRRIDRQRLYDLQKTIQDRITQHINAKWTRKIEALDTRDNSLWRMARLLKRPYCPTPAIVSEGLVHFTDKEKADAMARSYQKTCTLPPDSTPEQRRVSEEYSRLPERVPIPPRKLEKLLTASHGRFTEKYDSPSVRRALQAQLYGQKQTDREDTTLFISRKVALFRRLAPDTAEADQVSHIRDMLRAELRMGISMGLPLYSVDRLVQLATAYEADLHEYNQYKRTFAAPKPAPAAGATPNRRAGHPPYPCTNNWSTTNWESGNGIQRKRAPSASTGPGAPANDARVGSSPAPSGAASSAGPGGKLVGGRPDETQATVTVQALSRELSFARSFANSRELINPHKQMQEAYQEEVFPVPREAPVRYHVGQRVLTRAFGVPAHNLRPPWEGPHTVMEELGDGVYRVRRGDAEDRVFLKDLKVADLKRELEERECETTGKKADLQNRLKEALENEGENPDIFLFDIAGDINSALQSLIENGSKMQQKLEETSGNLRGMEQKLVENSTKMEQKLIENMDQKLLENYTTLEKKITENSSCLQKQIGEYVDGKFEEMENKLSHLEHVYHSQLKNRYQKSNESLQEFEADIARLNIIYSTMPKFKGRNTNRGNWSQESMKKACDAVISGKMDLRQAALVDYGREKILERELQSMRMLDW